MSAPPRTPEQVRLPDERLNSPLRHNTLTGGRARDYMRTKGFERSPVRSAFHQFSMKHVLADPSMVPTTQLMRRMLTRRYQLIRVNLGIECNRR